MGNGNGIRPDEADRRVSRGRGWTSTIHLLLVTPIIVMLMKERVLKRGTLQVWGFKRNLRSMEEVKRERLANSGRDLKEIV